MLRNCNGQEVPALGMKHFSLVVAGGLALAAILLHTSLRLLVFSELEGMETALEAYHRELQTVSTVNLHCSDTNLQWVGRIVTRADGTKSFDWGGSAVRMRITGTTQLGFSVKVRRRVLLQLVPAAPQCC